MYLVSQSLEICISGAMKTLERVPPFLNENKAAILANIFNYQKHSIVKDFSQL
jgi:hypothetical protein